MTKEEILKVIEKTAKNNIISDQRPEWGSNVSQVDIFNSGIKELEYRLKVAIEKLPQGI